MKGPWTRSRGRRSRAGWAAGAVLLLGLLLGLAARGWAAVSAQGGAMPAEPPFMRIVAVERSRFADDEGARRRLVRYLGDARGIAVLAIVSLETSRSVTLRSVDGPAPDIERELGALFERGDRADPRLPEAARTIQTLVAGHGDALADYVRRSESCRNLPVACAAYGGRVEIVIAGRVFHSSRSVSFRDHVPSEKCHHDRDNAYSTLTHPYGWSPQILRAIPQLGDVRQHIALALAVDQVRNDASDARPGVVAFFRALAVSHHYDWIGVVNLNEADAGVRYSDFRDDRDSNRCILSPAGEPGTPPPQAGEAFRPPPRRDPPAAAEAERPVPAPSAPGRPSPPGSLPGRAEAPPPDRLPDRPPDPPPAPAPPNLDPSIVSRLGEPTVTVTPRAPKADDAPPPPQPRPPGGGAGGAAPRAGLPLAPDLGPNALRVRLTWDTSPAFEVEGYPTLTDLRTDEAVPARVPNSDFSEAATGVGRAEGRFPIGRRGGRFAVGFRIETSRRCGEGTRHRVRVTFDLDRNAAFRIDRVRVDGKTVAPEGQVVRVTCDRGRAQVDESRVLQVTTVPR